MTLYEPYFVESISHVNEESKYYVFDVFPHSSKTNNLYDENYYYELHIETIDKIYYDNFLQNYIHIEFIDSETIEIYEGEFYEESESNGPIKFKSLELKRFEKESQFEWKPKFINIEREFRNLVNEKVADYNKTRNEVIENYRNVYNNSIIDLQSFDLNVKEITEPYLFRRLYYLFNNDSPEDSLNKLIDPDYYNNKQFKNWKQDFDKLNTKYEILKNINLSDYQTIKNHIIEIYKRTYRYMIPSLKYNYKNMDEDKYNKYFDHLMNKLNEIN